MSFVAELLNNFKTDNLLTQPKLIMKKLFSAMALLCSFLAKMIKLILQQQQCDCSTWLCYQKITCCLAKLPVNFSLENE
jgi:hypothetical protein